MTEVGSEGNLALDEAVLERSGDVPDLASGGNATRATQRKRGASGWSRRSRLSMAVGMAIGIAFYLVFGIVPAVATFVVSLTNYSGLAGAGTSFEGLSQYRAEITTDRVGFIASVEETAIFVVGVTVVQVIAALVLAHALASESRGNGFLRCLVFLPVVLGVTVLGLIWLLIFDPSQGPAAAFVGLFHAHSSFFGSNALAMPLVILVQVWASVGFGTLVFIGGLKAISPELQEAATIDGAAAWFRFRRITFPLLAPSFTVVVLLAVIGSVVSYNLIYVLTDGLYGTNTLGMLAFTSAFGGTANLGYGAAISIALFIITMVLAVPVQSLLRRRERRLVG